MTNRQWVYTQEPEDSGKEEILIRAKKDGGFQGMIEKELRLTVKFKVSDSVNEALNK